MKELIAVNPSRLSWCLKDFGLGKSELVRSLDISEKTLDKVFLGQKALTFNQLRKLGKLFGRGVLFFVDQNPITEDFIHTPQFRTLKNTKTVIVPEIRKLIENAEWHREVFLSILSESGNLTNLIRPLPNYQGHLPTEAGKMAREWLGLKAPQNIQNFRTALEEHGVLVFYAQGYQGSWHWDAESSILGFSLYYDQLPIIVIRNDQAKTQQAFTLMHELGHLILHRMSSIDSSENFLSPEQREAEANQFAGHLLVPDDMIDLVDYQKRPQHPSEFETWLKPIRENCGVSTDVALIRLIGAGRLTPDEYFKFNNWRKETLKPKSNYYGKRNRYKEPINIFGERYVRTILEALSENQITLTKACSYLDNIKLKALHELKSYYVGF